MGGLLRVGPYANRDDTVLTTWRSGIAAVAHGLHIIRKFGGIGILLPGFD